MKKCDFCGEMFDPDEADFIFDNPRLWYSNFKGNVCGDCANKIIEEGVEGWYFEKCERCGCKFDYVSEVSKFADHFPWYNGTTLSDHWNGQILCADCAIDDIEHDKFN